MSELESMAFQAPRTTPPPEEEQDWRKSRLPVFNRR